MKIRTQDLIGPALRWAVAKASGRLDNVIRDEARPGTSIIDIGVDEGGVVQVYVPGRGREPYEPWRPDEDWAQGGPIIERERICITYPRWDKQATALKVVEEFDDRWEMHGPTPLIAAMRCFVASKLGDEVEIPEGLLQ